MPQPVRLVGAAIAAALAAAALAPTAQAATHKPAAVQAHVTPATARTIGKRVTGATSSGITATFTPTYVANEGLTVSFDATGSSDSNSGATITGYSFAYGDGKTDSNTTGTATHTYGAPGSYTVTLTVTDSAGNTGTAASTVTPNGTDYTPDGPTRILDTRSGLGAAKAKVGNGGTVALQVTGSATGVPTNATAVVLNVTVTDAAAGGYISAYPDGITEPAASNQNFATGDTIPDLVTVKLGADGKADLTVNGTSATSVDLVGDLEGYYTPTSADGYAEIQPGRILDTRSGLNVTKAKIAEGQTAKLTVDGATATTDTATAGNTTEPLPASGITAVALNLTVTNTVESGVLTAYPDGATLPTASNLNYSAGETVANAAVVPVGADGKIDLSVTGNAGTATDVIADVEGYYTAGNGTKTSVFVPVDPARIYDTRQPPCSCAIPADEYLHIAFSPTTPVAYALNITDVSPTAGGNLAAYPDNTQDNITSTLNFGTGQLVGNYAQATVSATGIDIKNYSGGTVKIVVDEFGYFATS